MNSFRLSACIFIIVSCVSCYNSPLGLDTLVENTSLEIQTKSLPNDDLFVSMDDVECYIKFKELSAGKDIAVRSIVPVYGQGNRPLAYLLNYENGWELVSGDRRISPVLAGSEDGSLCLDSYPQPIHDWINRILEQIVLLQQQPNGSLFLKQREEFFSSNLDFWNAITVDEIFLTHLYSSTLTKSGEEEIPIDPSIPGHWELVSVLNNYKDYSANYGISLPDWHYSSPYNAYSPLKSYSQTERASAGCVAVAGALLLYHFHNSTAVPALSPAFGSVSGHVGSGYSQEFSDYSSSPWSLMQTNPNYCALLIGSVGKAVNMDYEDADSYSDIDSLVNNVMIPNNLYASYSGGYNLSQVASSLQNNSPVLIRGGYFNNPYYSGHAFLIKGYVCYRRCIMYEYHWVYEIDPEEIQPVAPSRFEYDYTSGDIVEISMNWGLGSTYNGIWFDSGEAWIVDGNTYSNGRRMYSGFSLQFD